MKPFHLLTGAFLSNWTVLAHSTGPQSPLIASQPGSDLLSLHKSLVEHSSITYNEHSVSQFLTSYLWHQNFTVETQLVAAATQTQHARHNILAYSGKTRQ